jgi:hypothetical protein
MLGSRRLAKIYERVRARVTGVRWSAEDGLQAAEALMIAFVGVILIAAVGIAFRGAIASIVNTIVNRITSGI